MVQAGFAAITSMGTVAGVASRRRRLRAEIKENLALIGDLEKSEVLREHTPVVGWLQGKVLLDVARLANVTLETGKTPIPWGPVTFAAFSLVGFGGWTYWLDHDGFVWYFIFPATVAFLMFISMLGVATNRQKPPDQTVEPKSGQTVEPKSGAATGDMERSGESAKGPLITTPTP